MSIGLYVIAGYFTAIIIKGFGGLKDVDWGWFFLAPLWLALYYTVVFFLKYIVTPILAFGLFISATLLAYGAVSGKWNEVWIWLTVW